MLFHKYIWCIWVLLPSLMAFNVGVSTKSFMTRPHIKEGLQIDPDGYFDIVEQPEQFLQIDRQIVS